MIKRIGLGLVDQPSEDPFDDLCASVLLQKLKQARLTVIRPSKTWPAEFRRLRKQHSKQAIKKVLDWYLDHLTEQYVPQAYSAKGFRNKFDAIKRAMCRQLANGERQLEISKDARKLYVEFVYHEWPYKEKQVLLHVIQRTLDDYNAFFNRLKVVRKVLPARERLLDHVLANLPFPNDFVRFWIEKMHQLAHNWPPWTEDSFKSITFQHDSPFFRPLLDNILNEYVEYGGSQSKAWQQVVEQL